MKLITKIALTLEERESSALKRMQALNLSTTA